MATKYLARTAIEGGRYFHNCWFRRHSNGVVRTCVRQQMRALRDDDELDAFVPQPRTHVGVMFHDKLSAAERWLRKQHGRPWNNVRSDLVARFDWRTTAGRHILFDHLLQWVQTEPMMPRYGNGMHQRYIMEVGRGGILKEFHRRKKSR